MSDIFKFGLKTPDKGFVIKGDVDSPILVAIRGKADRYYQPMDTEDLYLQFAKIKQTTKAALTFAKTYGFLSKADDEEYSETVSSWLSEACYLQLAIELWEVVSGNEDLASNFKWDKDKFIYRGTKYTLIIQAQPTGLVTAAPFSSDGKTVTFNFPKIINLKESEKRHVILIYLQRIINEHVEHSCELFTELANGHLESKLYPADLLTAVWLQFSQSIQDNQRFKQCPAPECGGWFLIGKKTARKSRVYCSTACKVRAARQKVKEAKQLFDDGTAVENIAIQLNADLDAVKGWIK